MRILIFGDEYGIPMLIKYIPRENILGFVVAGIRPQQVDIISRLAIQQNLPLIIQPRIKAKEYDLFVDAIRNLAPNIILVNSYSMLISEEVLSIPSEGGINIHGALLPQYRGANPIQWALLNNEIETGVTMHKMTAEFDCGEIIAQKHVPIFFNDTWKDLQKRIATATESLLEEEMPKILVGKVDSIAQDETKANRYYRRHPEDGLIDWNKSVLYIYNLIRALVSPHPGAFYYSEEQKITLNFYHTLPQVANLKYSQMGGKQTLKSQQVYLTPLTEVDLPEIFKWNNDQERVIINAQYKPVQEDQYHDLFQEIQKSTDAIFFGIRCIQTNKLIGFCQLDNIDMINKNAELCIQIRDLSERNKSYGTEAVNILLGFAFNDLEIHRVYLHVLSTNFPAIRTFEKNGLIQEGLLRQAAFVNGEFLDEVFMAILKSGYDNR
jgi:methionyl-tRNA formyltransferase